MRERVSLVGSLLLCATCTVGAQVAPTDAEIDKFLSSSGIAAGAANAQKIVSARALRNGSLPTVAINCLASAEVLDAQLSQVYRPLVARNIRDAADLNAAIRFHESPVGRRIAEYLERMRAERLAAAYRGEDPPSVTEPTFDADESAAIREWEASAHHAAIQALEEALQNARGTPEHRAWLSASMARCKDVPLNGSNAASNAAYEKAQPQARADALNPETRDYYLNKLRPAFTVVLQTMLNACASKFSDETQATFGLVLTVTSQGAAKQILWRTPNEFTACLETGIRAAKYPPAPKDEFYLGMAGGAGA